MSVNNIFKWQEKYWETLLAKPESLPHALLLVGPSGIGKGEFAEALVARLLCEKAQANEAACGECDGCRWLAGGNHPDYRKVTLEEAEEDEESSSAATKKALPTQIRIQQIRTLDDFVFTGSHRQGRRVIVIDPAEAMNIAAANSLLKMLEEPPSSVYFILVTSNQKRLLPTLRSRCRQVALAVPDRAVASAWLREQGVAKPELELGLAAGAPLKALDMHSHGGTEVLDGVFSPLQNLPVDPLALSAHWESLRRKNPEFRLEHLVDAVQKWLYDLTRVRMGAAPRYLSSRQTGLQAIAGKVNPARLYRLHADLLKIRATARHPLNELLFLEDLAARYAAAVATPRSR